MFRLFRYINNTNYLIFKRKINIFELFFIKSIFKKLILKENIKNLVGYNIFKKIDGNVLRICIRLNFKDDSGLIILDYKFIMFKKFKIKNNIDKNLLKTVFFDYLIIFGEFWYYFDYVYYKINNVNGFSCCEKNNDNVIITKHLNNKMIYYLNLSKVKMLNDIFLFKKIVNL